MADITYRLPRTAGIDRIIGDIQPLVGVHPYPITHCSLIFVPDADGMRRLVIHTLGDIENEKEVATIQSHIDARIKPIIAAHEYDIAITA